MSIDKWEDEANNRPMNFAIKAILFIAVLVGVIAVISYAFGWIGQGAQVVKDEFGPKAALKKYEWFIDQANRIKKMDQDVQVFQQREAAIEKKYESYGKDKAKWSPDIRIQYNREIQQSTDDRTAIVSQRNNLAQEYNAASEKFNWAPFNTRDDKPVERFTNLE